MSTFTVAVSRDESDQFSWAGWAASCGFTEPQRTASGDKTILVVDGLTLEQTKLAQQKLPWKTVVTLSTGLLTKKFAKNAAIDDVTRLRIAAGFNYGSPAVKHSLSANAQRNYTDRYLRRDEISYPPGVTFNSLDDSGKTVLTSAADVLAFYNAAMAALEALYDSGTALKDSVRAATTEAEVDAVVDER